MDRHHLLLAAAGASFIAAGVLAYYRSSIIRPQVMDLHRRMTLPEFQGTAHGERLQWVFGRMRRHCRNVGAAAAAALALGIALGFILKWE